MTNHSEPQGPNPALDAAPDVYRELFECNPHPMWVYDKASLAFLAVNDAAIARYGYSRAEFLRMTILDIRPEEDRASLLDWTKKDHGAVWKSGAWRHRWKDGTVRDVEISSHACRFNGRRARLVVADDITDVILAAEESAIRARQQAAIADLGSYGLATTNLSAFLDRTVRQTADVLGVEYCKVLELLPDGSALLLRAGVGWQDGRVGSAMTEIGPQSQAGYTLRCKDPVVVEDLRTEARFRGPSLLTDHGVVSGVSVIVGDLESPYGVLGAHTTRRREFTQHDVHFLQGVAHLVAAAAQRSAGEEALRESEERFRALFENSLDAILLTVPNGRILAANREACRMFQHTEEELRALGREGIVDLSDPRLQPLLAERARTGRARGELRFLRRDGSAFPGTVSSGGFRTRRGDVCSSITVHDLTAAKQAEARMAEQLAELRRWHDATLGREQRILELKAEVNALLKERGCAARYQSAEPEQAAWPAPPAELGTRERD